MSCTKGGLKRRVDLGSAHTSSNGDMGCLTTGIDSLLFNRTRLAMWLGGLSSRMSDASVNKQTLRSGAQSDSDC